MKKIMICLVALFAMVFAFTGCTKCSNEKPSEPTDTTVVSKTIINDKAHMDSIDKTYKYFETYYLFAGTVDTLQKPEIDSVSSIFQTFDESTMKATVYFSEHKLAPKDSTSWKVVENAWWGEDLNLRDYKYQLTVEEAFNVMQKADVIKPKARACVLRAQLGPKHCNPQYIFGNETLGMIFVDAITAKVTTINPAFGNAKTIGVE